MKKFLTIALCALLGAALPLAFTSCSSDDDDSKEKFDKAWFNALLAGSHAWIVDGDLQFFGGGFQQQAFSVNQVTKEEYRIFSVSSGNGVSLIGGFTAFLKQNAKDPWSGTLTISGEEDLGVSETKDYGTWAWRFALDEDGRHATDRIVLTSPDDNAYSLHLGQ